MTMLLQNGWIVPDGRFRRRVPGRLGARARRARRGGRGRRAAGGGRRSSTSRGAVVTPGLVNTHHHLYQTLTRARAQEATLFEWLVELYPVWARIDAESEYAAARTGLAELALSGCTTVFDHHYVFPRGRPGLWEAEVQAAGEIGVRIVASRGSMDLGESHGGLPPDSLVEPIDDILADTERLAGLQDADGMVQLAVAPCSPFSVTKELMAESAALARRLGLKLHTHLAETVEEDAYCLELFGCRPVEYLERARLGRGRRLVRALRPPLRARTSPPSAAPASASRTARRRTCASAPGSRRCASSSTRARRSGSASTARRRTSAPTSSSR